jgi:putative DNA primase/helicase
MTVAELLSNGFALVPVPCGRKGPAIKGWNQRANVVSDPSRADELEGSNIGLAHAYCEPNPTCALDIDDYRESLPWFSARGIDLLGALCAKDAVLSTSQREYRIKAYYRLPIGVGPLQGVKVRSAEGVNIHEFRCATENGRTEQDLLPPSIHPDTGKPYIWVGKSDLRRIPLIPSDLLEVWQKELVSRTPRGASAGTGYPNHPETPAEVARLLEKLSYISADCDYETYRNVVWAILGTAWSCAEDIACNWCKSAPDRFEEADFLKVVRSFDPTRNPRPTMGTIVFLARREGWHV